MRVTFHKANNNEWVWTVQSTGNWKTIGYSSETFKRKKDCINNFSKLTSRAVNHAMGKAEELYGDVMLAVGPEWTEPWEVRFDD